MYLSRPFIIEREAEKTQEHAGCKRRLSLSLTLSETQACLHYIPMLYKKRCLQKGRQHRTDLVFPLYFERE